MGQREKNRRSVRKLLMRDAEVNVEGDEIKVLIRNNLNVYKEE